MGLEFKPYFAWEDEEHDRHVKQCGSDEKQTTTTNSSTPAESAQSDISDESLSSGGGGGYGNQEEEEEEQEQQQQQAPAPERNPNGGGLVFVHADGTPPAAPVAAPLNNNSNNAGGRGELSLALALAAVNGERREYAVLVASEEENVNEYKSFFSIVLDCPQFLGQGETKESALRQARTLLHYALGSSLLKNEAIPAPSFGAELEVTLASSPFFLSNNARVALILGCIVDDFREAEIFLFFLHLICAHAQVPPLSSEFRFRGPS